MQGKIHAAHSGDGAKAHSLRGQAYGVSCSSTWRRWFPSAYETRPMVGSVSGSSFLVVGTGEKDMTE